MRAFTTDQLAAVRARLAERGETVQDFCQQHGLSYHVVMAILHGRSAASRGEGHRAAVLMELKRQPPKRRRVKKANGLASERRVAQRRTGDDRRVVKAVSQPTH